MGIFFYFILARSEPFVCGNSGAWCVWLEARVRQSVPAGSLYKYTHTRLFSWYICRTLSTLSSFYNNALKEGESSSLNVIRRSSSYVQVLVSISILLLSNRPTITNKFLPPPFSQWAPQDQTFSRLHIAALCVYRLSIKKITRSKWEATLKGFPSEKKNRNHITLNVRKSIFLFPLLMSLTVLSLAAIMTGFNAFQREKK